MAGLTTTKQAHVSHDMGMHTEALRGKTQQRFFDVTEAGGGYGYPDALDVDFNKRAELDCEKLDTKQINTQLRDLMKRGYGTIVLQNPGSKHSIAVGILNRLNLYIEGSCGYFALRPARWTECEDQGPRRLGLRRKHAVRHHPHREECRLAIRRGPARRRSSSARVRSARAPASTRRAATSSSAAIPARSRAS